MANGLGQLKSRSRCVAGALLTMIADDLAPEAYSWAHKLTGIATVLGFILAVFLSIFE